MEYQAELSKHDRHCFIIPVLRVVSAKTEDRNHKEPGELVFPCKHGAKFGWIIILFRVYLLKLHILSAVSLSHPQRKLSCTGLMVPQRKIGNWLTNKQTNGGTPKSTDSLVCLHIGGAMSFLAHDAFVSHNTRRSEGFLVGAAHG
jgi:hypothetical protein